MSFKKYTFSNKKSLSETQTFSHTKSLDEQFSLLEGVHDKGIFKVVFLGGGPGSGKDFVLKNTLAGNGLTEINSDKALEYLMDKNGLDKTMPDEEEQERNLVRGRSKNITELRQRLAIQGRNGLIINGTGDNPKKIAKIKKQLEDLGYESKMIMVNTSDEVSRQRNIKRGQDGGRTVPENIRKEKWDAVQAARSEYAKMFGNNYHEFDNSEDLRTAPEEVKQQKTEEMTNLFKDVQDFVSQPPKNDISSNWVGYKLHQDDKLPPVTKKAHDKLPPKGSKAHEEAIQLGLTYYGFGRYGKEGTVTHRSVHDKLVDVRNITKMNEEFDSFITEAVTFTIKADTPEEASRFLTLLKDGEHEEQNEEYSLSDNSAMTALLLGKSINESYEKHTFVKDSNNKIKKFVHAGHASKEALKHNGEVANIGNQYVIKIKGNTNAKISKKPVQVKQKATRRYQTEQFDSGISKAASGEYNNSRTIRTEEVKGESYKITLQQIRERQKQNLHESIDKGIEPGISMAAAGESPARDMGEKIKKRTGKATQVAETIGGSGEVATSMSAQKEDELKKQGIDLKTWKAKRVIG